MEDNKELVDLYWKAVDSARLFGEVLSRVLDSYVVFAKQSKS